MSIDSLIRTFGYWAVGVGTLAEGEVVLLVAAMAARRGYLKLAWVVAVGILGSVVGDQIFFLVGRRYGPRMLAKHPEWDKKSQKIRGWLDRHRTLIILSFRFLAGVRTLTVILLGMSTVRLRTFLLLNAAGGVLWGVSYGAGGYFLGKALEPVLARLKAYEGLIFVLVIAAWLIITGLRKWKASRK